MPTKPATLSLGDAVVVKGMGKHARGTISRAPEPTDTALVYRCDFNKGEHAVKAELVKLKKVSIYDNGKKKFRRS